MPRGHERVVEMLRRTRAALALTGALALAGLGLAAQPALATGRGAARSAGACPTEWCQTQDCRAGDDCGDCAGYVDADGDGVCDNRADGECRGTGIGRGAGHHAGHRCGRCGW